eukprot:16657-Rhodomonas_salina.2
MARPTSHTHSEQASRSGAASGLGPETDFLSSVCHGGSRSKLDLHNSLQVGPPIHPEIEYKNRIPGGKGAEVRQEGFDDLDSRRGSTPAAGAGQSLLGGVTTREEEACVARHPPRQLDIFW